MSHCVRRHCTRNMLKKCGGRVKRLCTALEAGIAAKKRSVDRTESRHGFVNSPQYFCNICRAVSDHEVSFPSGEYLIRVRICRRCLYRIEAEICRPMTVVAGGGQCIVRLRKCANILA